MPDVSTEAIASCVSRRITEARAEIAGLATYGSSEAEKRRAETALDVALELLALLSGPPQPYTITHDGRDLPPLGLLTFEASIAEAAE